jgi:hypothetical protein
MKKLSIAFILLFATTSANAILIGNLVKPKSIVGFVIINPPPVQAPAPVIAPLVNPVIAPLVNIVTPPAAEQNVSTLIPEQNFVIFTEETKQLINEIVNCVDVPNEGGHDNVSAVPVPASLPLMATALGIFGITRRRKTFK